MSSFKYISIVATPDALVGVGAPAPLPHLSTLLGGGTTGIMGSGALEVSAATLSGAGAVDHAGAGALEVSAATGAATGAIDHPQQGSASLTAGVVVVSSDNAVDRTGTGALEVSAATGAGAGVVGHPQLQPANQPLTQAPLPAIGTLLPGPYNDAAASVATITGVGTVNGAAQDVTGSGALDAGAAAVSSADGAIGRVGAGAPAASAAAITAEAQRGSVQSGAGALAAGSGTLAGAGVVGHVGAGAFSPLLGGEVAGTALHSGPDGIVGVGTLTVSGATAAGAGGRQIEDMGGDVSIFGVSPEVAGEQEVVFVPSTSAPGPLPHIGALLYRIEAVTGVGTLAPTAAGVSGNGTAVAPAKNVTGTGALSPSLHVVASTGAVYAPGTGAFAPAVAVVSGSAVRSVTGTGVLTADVISLVGNGNIGDQPLDIPGAGDLVVSSEAVAGTGVRQSEDLGGTVALSALAATVSGTGQRLTGVTNVTGTGALTVTKGAVASAAKRGPAGTGVLTPTGVSLASGQQITRVGAGAMVVAASGAIAGAGVAGGHGNEITGTAPLEAPVPGITAEIVLNVYEPGREGAGDLLAGVPALAGAGLIGVGTGVATIAPEAPRIMSVASRGVVGSGVLTVRTPQMQTPSVYANPTDMAVDLTIPTTRDVPRPLV